MSIWDAYTKIYDRLWVQRVSLAPTRRAIIAALEAEFQSKPSDASMSPLYSPEQTPLRLLDVSCGTGQLLSDIEAAWPHWQRLGLEPSRLGDVARDKGHTVVGAAIEGLDHLESDFSVVTCSHALPYYPDQAEALCAMGRRLRPGGLLCLAHAETITLYDRAMLALVKLTTTRASYPRPEALISWLNTPSSGLSLERRVRINGRGIPSITLYIARKQP